MLTSAACSTATQNNAASSLNSAETVTATSSQENSTMAKLGMPAPKRVAPPSVPPIAVGPYRYEPLLWGRDRGFGQNGGYLSVVDAASNKEIAVIKIYGIEYNQKMESDVQDVFIKSMELRPNGTQLLVTDERARRYAVDLATREVQTLP
jgi:hypothetical protein